MTEKCTRKLSINKDVHSMACRLNNESWEFPSMQKGFR